MKKFIALALLILICYEIPTAAQPDNIFSSPQLDSIRLFRMYPSCRASMSSDSMVTFFSADDSVLFVFDVVKMEYKELNVSFERAAGCMIRLAFKIGESSCR
jgi:hypothetical protein